MRLTCPCCGAQVSAEAWQNDVTVRQFLAALEKLPGRVRDLALPYLGLFRRAGGREGSACGSRGLAWPRALRLLLDLAALVDPGTVHWEGGEERPAPPYLWADALDAVLARRPKALENHNYLRRVAWEMAERLAGQAERAREDARRQADGGRKAVDTPLGAEVCVHAAGPDEKPLSPEELRQFWATMKDSIGRIGNPPGKGES